MKTTTTNTTTKGKVKKVVAKKPTTKKTRQTGNKPTLKKAKASKGKAPGAKKPDKAAVAVKRADAAQAKMLFKIGDIVVHENGKIYKVVKPPYAKKTVITIDAVKQRAGKSFGDAKAMPTAKFVRPAKPGEKSATPTTGAKTKAASPTGKAKASVSKNETPSDKKAKVRKPTVASAMRALFAEHGLEATYAQAETVAKAAKPDTKFARSHWAWYRAQYKKTITPKKDTDQKGASK